MDIDLLDDAEWVEFIEHKVMKKFPRKHWPVLTMGLPATVRAVDGWQERVGAMGRFDLIDYVGGLLWSEHDKAMFYAKVLAEFMQAEGVHSARAWQKKPKQVARGWYTRVYFMKCHLKISQDGSAGDAHEWHTVRSLYPKQRKMVMTAYDKYKAWQREASPRAPRFSP